MPLALTALSCKPIRSSLVTSGRKSAELPSQNLEASPLNSSINDLFVDDSQEEEMDRQQTLKRKQDQMAKKSYNKKGKKYH